MAVKGLHQMDELPVVLPGRAVHLVGMCVVLGMLGGVEAPEILALAPVVSAGAVAQPCAARHPGSSQGADKLQQVVEAEGAAVAVLDLCAGTLI